MKVMFATLGGAWGWTAASAVALVVEGGSHQLTAWNWTYLAAAFAVGAAVGWVAS